MDSLCELIEIFIYFYPLKYFLLLQLSTAGGRLIISSDGVWDALSAEETLSCCRGLPADVAATQIIKVILCKHEVFLFFSSTFYFCCLIAYSICRKLYR